MPGLFGIVAKTEKLASRDLQVMARRMADAMRGLPWQRAELWGQGNYCGGRVDSGVLNPEGQPFATGDGRRHVWLDGECRLPQQTRSDTPSADALSSLVDGPRPTLAHADGAFALAVVHAGGLALATDRLGFRPLYWTETADWFAYAAEVKALLAIHDHLPAIDEIALRQYFAFDHMLGDRTWWTGISLIPPANVWHVSRGVVTRTEYWSFDDLHTAPCDPAGAQREFGRLWTAAVRDYRRPGTTPVLLSGGLDSRLLVAELVAQEADIVAVTYGSNESPEVRPARAVAAIAGIEHRVCEWTTQNWWQGREAAIWRTDGLVNANHLHPAIAVEEMRLGTCYSPMNMLGDLLFGGSHLDRTPWTELRERPELLMKIRFMANPLFGVEEALDASMPDIRQYASGPSSDCFHLRQRVRRYVLYSPGCFAPYCETVYPGAGLEFLQLFLGSLTDADRWNHKFYNVFLAERHPKFFANLPWQGTGRGLRESPHVRRLRDLQRRLRRLLRKPRRKTPANQWFVNYPAAVRQQRVCERLLAQDLLFDDVLHGAARAALLTNAERPLAAESVIAILAFETYLRQVTAMPRLRIQTNDAVRPATASQASPRLGGSRAGSALVPDPATELVAAGLRSAGGAGR